MKSQIVKLRKQIFENLKTKALELENRTPELDQYLADQHEFAKRPFELIGMDDIKQSVLAANIVFLGDFHTFDQNIRNVLRLIRFITEEPQPCALALEMIHADHQIYIDAFLERHITELEFLESIDYHDSWRFPWTHYKLIFDLAKEFNLSVIGLNTEGNLTERDEFAANRLQEISQKNPQSKILVFYGELHITQNKIPKLYKNRMPNHKQAIIHQNLDEVYWELVKSDLDEGIVKFNPEEFCLISAPPWIKYESMIYWYENLCDDPDFDIHEYIIENEKKFFSDDTKETFYHLCCEISKNLQLEITESDIEDFNLYDHTNLEYIEEKLESSLPKEVFEFYQYLISTNRSFKFPKDNIFYCSSYSMNRISYLAGIHIFQLHLDKDQLDILKSENNPNIFCSFAFDAMFAYFFSKVINPHRKCDLYRDLQHKYKESEFLLEKQFIKLSIDSLDNSLDSLNLEGHKLQTLYEAATIHGHILGEYLYREYAHKKVEIGLQDYFKGLEITPNYFEQLKHKLIPQKDFRSHQKRYF